MNNDSLCICYSMACHAIGTRQASERAKRAARDLDHHDRIDGGTRGRGWQKCHRPVQYLSASCRASRGLQFHEAISPQENAIRGITCGTKKFQKFQTVVLYNYHYQVRRGATRNVT